VSRGQGVSRTAVVASKRAPVADRGVRVGVVGPLYALVVVVPLFSRPGRGRLARRDEVPEG
jgi:hypothetical protein